MSWLPTVNKTIRNRIEHVTIFQIYSTTFFIFNEQLILQQASLVILVAWLSKIWLSGSYYFARLGSHGTGRILNRSEIWISLGLHGNNITGRIGARLTGGIEKHYRVNRQLIKPCEELLVEDLSDTVYKNVNSLQSVFTFLYPSKSRLVRFSSS